MMGFGWRFGAPWVLLLLPLVLWAIFRYARRRPASVVFGAGPLLRQAGRGLVGRLAFLPPLLRVLAISLLILGAARPQVRSPELATREGIDIVVALDLSGSMARSLRGQRPRPGDPPRLEVAREVLITELLEKRPNDRIGLVIFGAEAYTRAPLTLDHELLKRMVDDLSTDLFDQEFASATAIGDAIGVAANRLRGASSRTRAIILLTDGASNAGVILPEDAARAAVEEVGARIYPILIGQEKSESVDPAQLERLSELSGTGEDIAKAQGNSRRYYAAQDRPALAKGLQSILDSLDRSLIEAAGKESYREVGTWLAAFALLLLCLEALLKAWRFGGMP